MDEATRISLKDQFNSLLVRAIEGRRGGMALMRVLEELDFYNSPASAKHHLNVPGGLVMHMVLNDQGGGRMSVTQGTSGTLRAQEHGHPPITFDKMGGTEKT